MAFGGLRGEVGEGEGGGEGRADALEVGAEGLGLWLGWLGRVLGWMRWAYHGMVGDVKGCTGGCWVTASYRESARVCFSHAGDPSDIAPLSLSGCRVNSGAIEGA